MRQIQKNSSLYLEKTLRRSMAFTAICWLPCRAGNNASYGTFFRVSVYIIDNTQKSKLMSLPKEPRQIMINLMYLVLTAMLALNVTSEILHAFKVLSKSLDASNVAIDNKTNATYQAFLENEKAPGKYERVHPYR